MLEHVRVEHGPHGAPGVGGVEEEPAFVQGGPARAEVADEWAEGLGEVLGFCGGEGLSLFGQLEGPHRCPDLFPVTARPFLGRCNCLF